jgi:hypothetical protein
MPLSSVSSVSRVNNAVDSPPPPPSSPPPPSDNQDLYAIARNERLPLATTTTVGTFGTGAVVAAAISTACKVRINPSVFLKFAPATLPMVAGGFWQWLRDKHNTQHVITPPPSPTQNAIREIATFAAFGGLLAAQAGYAHFLANVNPATRTGKALKLTGQAWIAACSALGLNGVFKAFPAHATFVRAGAQGAAAGSGVVVRTEHDRLLELPVSDTGRPTHVDWSKPADPTRVAGAAACFIPAGLAMALQTAGILPTAAKSPLAAARLHLPVSLALTFGAVSASLLFPHTPPVSVDRTGRPEDGK